MQQIDQIPNIRPKTMSDGSRPTSRWSSSRLTTATTTQSNTPMDPITRLIVSRKRFCRPTRNNQQTFAHMAKTKHNMEEIFKLYYSNNNKLETFKQTITGTQISSPPVTIPAPASTPIQNQFTETSSDVFKVRHCVSREDINPLDNEYQAVMNELNKLPLRRTDQVRKDINGPMIIQPVKLLSSPPAEPMPSSLVTLKNLSSTRQDELPLVKPSAFARDVPSNPLEPKNIKRSRSAFSQRPLSSTIPVLTQTQTNNRREPINSFHSLLPTTNLSEEQNQQHILTGTAITAHQRPLSRSVRYSQRPKSTMTAAPGNVSSQQSNMKTSPFSSGYDMPDSPVHIVTQAVASIPSKCSRYVLVTIPQAPTRYTIPTSVERLLLPERFPVLFQNILHSSEHYQNNN